jgi:hypothetical protein
MPAQELFASNWVNKLLETLKNRPDRSMIGTLFPNRAQPRQSCASDPAMLEALAKCSWQRRMFTGKRL